MNEAEYLELCDACDRVLLSGDTSTERVAISWLHVIREHPMFLQSYADLFDSSQRSLQGLRQVTRLLKNRLWIICRGVKKQSSHSPLWFSSEEPTRAADILFVSHLLNVSHAGRDDDFYFGSLPARLTNNGCSTMVALIDHSGRSSPDLAKKWHGAVSPRVILSPSLGLKSELQLRRRLKQESIKLRKLSREQRPGLLRLTFRRASEEALSSWSRATLRIFEQLKTLVKSVKPRVIVVTYEGHAWERLAFAAAREVFPKIVCVGYQHAALFRLQHAVRRSIAPRFDPDRILTAGRIGKRQLQHCEGAQNERVAVLGSFRHAVPRRSARGVEGCGRRDEHKQHACLVIPEGVESECRILFEFSVACAIACPELKFIWRLHPVVSFQTLLSQNGSLRNRPKNIVMSQGSLEDDIESCRWSLYRGTTAVIQAVNAGLRPLYLSRPGEMTIDPLYELEAWKVCVNTVQEFVNVIGSDLDNEFEALGSSKQAAIQYCSQIFEPLDKTALLRVIEVDGESHRSE